MAFKKKNTKKRQFKRTKRYVRRARATGKRRTRSYTTATKRYTKRFSYNKYVHRIKKQGVLSFTAQWAKEYADRIASQRKAVGDHLVASAFWLKFAEDLNRSYAFRINNKTISRETKNPLLAIPWMYKEILGYKMQQYDTTDVAIQRHLTGLITGVLQSTYAFPERGYSNLPWFPVIIQSIDPGMGYNVYTKIATPPSSVLSDITTDILRIIYNAGNTDTLKAFVTAMTLNPLLSKEAATSVKLQGIGFDQATSDAVVAAI